MIDISVIIPVYNAAPLIRRCLDSVLAQKGDYTYEVLLIDDGSTDESVEIIKSYENPDFKLFQQKNAGPAAARNVGIFNAQGKYLAFLDADDYWLPTFFNETIGYLKKVDKTIVGVNVAQKHLSLSKCYFCPSSYKQYESPIVINDFFDFWATNQHVCTGSVMLRTEIAKECGGFRECLRFGEDWEFWACVSLCGKWAFIPEVLFVSDGCKVTQKNGWLSKMEVRWKNSPTIAEWQNRIVAKKPEIENSIGYKKAQGFISRDLTYSMLLSGRIRESRQEAIDYGDFFTNDKIGRLMNICKHSYICWLIMAKMLKFREYHRNI